MTHQQTLVLNAAMQPQRVISWQHAVTLMFSEKVDVLATYDDWIRSPSIAIRTPAVLRIRRFVAPAVRRVRFSRANIALRDRFRCQYCDRALARSELSLDHVIPRVRGGQTVWENIVAACRRCNGMKGARSPREAGMRLRTNPERPKTLPVHELQLQRTDVPPVWRDFLFSG